MGETYISQGIQLVTSVMDLLPNRLKSNLLNILIIAAHPDAPEEYAGGMAALIAELGYWVKFLTLTNGDIGHYDYKGPELSKRRHKEALTAAERLGVQEYTIWDISDGWLVPTPENRDKVILFRKVGNCEELSFSNTGVHFSTYPKK